MIEYFNEDCILGMAIDTTDISEADLTLWGVSSLVLMVLGAVGFELDKHYCDIANERVQKAMPTRHRGENETLRRCKQN